MGIYDKIQVAMIAILVKFENISRATRVLKKSARKCAASSEFLFCLLKLLSFFVFISVISVMVARAC